jgi:alkylation response protein AidB-like acyl-CoA dehydrogenase
MQKKDNFFTDNQDLDFHFENKIEWDVLFDMTLPEDREALGVASKDEYKKSFKDLLTQLGEVVGTTIAANQHKVATQDLTLKNGEVHFPQAISENIQVLKDMGIAGMGIASRFGGLPGPIAAELPAVEMLYRACPSTYINITWYAPVARVIDEFGSEEQKLAIIPRIASGEWSGNMALTEPDAGSDLAAIRTYGEKQADGSWRLYGSKRFISNGCGQVSLVLAKGEKGAKGLQNLNLYVCLRKNDDGSNNYEVTKIEEKVGLHGSPTCELKYDGSKAELIGEEGAGFQYMLHLMNEARVGVAIQGVGVMESVLRLAKEYTSQRQAWGRPIAQHELLAEKLLDLEVSTHAARSLCYQAANALAIYQTASRKLLDDASLTQEAKDRIKDIKKKYERRLRRWTPLVKYYAAEQAFYNARQCLQMHGGYGFTKEYQPEWWLRESLIIPVYEGTSQIQALMCIKDTMKDIIRRPTNFIESALGSQLAQISQRDPLRRKLANLKKEFNGTMVNIMFQLVKANMKASMGDVNPMNIRKMIQVITKDLVKFENLRPALLHAERVTEMKSAICIAESLIADAAIDSTRTWIAERWMNKAIPRFMMLRAEVEQQEPVLAHRLSEVPLMNMAAQMNG